MTRYAKLTAWLVGAWFVVSLAASALHLYQAAPGRPPAAFGLAVAAPILIFVAWLSLSPAFRKFALSLNPRVLTLIQSLRIGGYVFLVLASFGILPRLFALPAGWGDIAIGVTAPLVALKLAATDRRGGFMVWQFLGIADLVNAIALGTLAPVIAPHGISTSAMSMLPLSLIPTFGVPLFLILHGICIAQAATWHEQPVRPAAPLLGSLA
jgi:hypothetical protein